MRTEFEDDGTLSLDGSREEGVFGSGPWSPRYDPARRSAALAARRRWCQRARSCSGTAGTRISSQVVKSSLRPRDCGGARAPLRMICH